MKIITLNRVRDLSSYMLNDYIEPEETFLKRVENYINENNYKIQSIQFFRHNDYKGVDEAVVTIQEGTK